RDITSPEDRDGGCTQEGKRYGANNERLGLIGDSGPDARPGLGNDRHDVSRFLPTQKPDCSQLSPRGIRWSSPSQGDGVHKEEIPEPTISTLTRSATTSISVALF